MHTFECCPTVVVPPVIERENVDVDPRVVINQTEVLNCAVSGIPTPDVKWLRNDEPVSVLRCSGGTSSE